METYTENSYWKSIRKIHNGNQEGKFMMEMNRENPKWK